MAKDEEMTPDSVPREAEKNKNRSRTTRSSAVEPSASSPASLSLSSSSPPVLYSRKQLETLVAENKFFRPDYVNDPIGRGCSRLRLFNQNFPEVILFRDHHAWCPFCQKAWILLEELRIPYAVVKVTMHNYGKKEFWYTKYVYAKGTFPCLIVLKSKQLQEKVLRASLEEGADRESLKSMQGLEKMPRKSADSDVGTIDTSSGFAFQAPLRNKSGGEQAQEEEQGKSTRRRSLGSDSVDSSAPTTKSFMETLLGTVSSATGSSSSVGRESTRRSQQGDYELINDSTPVMIRLVELARQKMQDQTTRTTTTSPTHDDGANDIHDLSDPAWDLRDKQTAAICFNFIEGKLLHYFYRWLSCQNCDWNDANAKAIEAENKRLFSQVCEELSGLLKVNIKLRTSQTQSESNGTNTKVGTGRIKLKTFSISDCVLLPWLERINSQLFYYKGFDLRAEFPVIAAWFASMEKRSSYLMSKGDFFTHTHAIPHRIRPCFFDEWTVGRTELQNCWQAVECGGGAAAIVGCRAVPDAWDSEVCFEGPTSTTFDEDNGRSEILAMPSTSQEQQQLLKSASFEAAYRVLRFWDVLESKTESVKIVEDKNAFDTAMRLVVMRLIVFGENDDVARRSSSVHTISTVPVEEIPNPEQVLLVIQYFKDRISIPRDMGYYAGKRFRQVMFSLIEELCRRLKKDPFDCPIPIPYDNRYDVRPDKFVGKQHYEEIPKVLQVVLFR
ncbi:unnamed protein product [Amoebophrya sp. A120]|nr:unnamed protein product [Amoebophrya sp. A120]|eukprot:GSA120T00007759001.1